MRVVQALHRLRDMLDREGDEQTMLRRLRRVLNDPDQGALLRADLADGLSTLPAWMQALLKPLLATHTEATADEGEAYARGVPPLAGRGKEAPRQ